ncbi:hypothetical protein ACLOJK_034261, partial [Asimina triloba]
CTAGALISGAPSSPKWLKPAKPIHTTCPFHLHHFSAVAASGDSVLIPDLVGVDEWANDQMASDQSTAMIAHG